MRARDKLVRVINLYCQGSLPIRCAGDIKAIRFLAAEIEIDIVCPGRTLAEPALKPGNIYMLGLIRRPSPRRCTPASPGK